MKTVSLSARIKCALALIILTIVGLGPFPITSAIGLFIVLFRPQWFKNLVDSIYAE
jgi:hypothetical protein